MSTAQVNESSPDSQAQSPESGAVQRPDAPPLAAGYDLRNVGVTLSTAQGPLEILRGIDLCVGQGEILGIVGRSGTGKSTLLRVLGGLLKPTAGQAMIDGKAIDGPPRQVVTVFQDYASALLPWRTLERNVGLPLERICSHKERTARVTEALTMVGLEDRAKDYPWRLSGGMQQRVQIARALVLRPRVLLMDEPFGALDAMTRAQLQDQLLTLQRESGPTIIFITHDLEEAIYLGDRVNLIAGSPGHMPVQVETQLPRDRDQISTRELPRYLELRHQMHQELKVQHSK